MSGSKTRFGFSGGSDPPDSEELRAARTVFGRDIHLQLPAGATPPQFPVAPTPVPPAPPAWTPPARPISPDIELEDVNPRRQRQRPRQSRLARFLGRWTRSGRFESRSRVDLDADDNVEIPRDTTGRNVLLVLLVALVTFSVTLAVVKLRQRFAVQPSAATEPVPVAAPPQDPTQPAQPVPSSPPPSQAAPAPPAPLPAAAKGLGDPIPATSPRKAPHAGRPMARPPDHRKNDLLPLAP
jgi:hypothetical protein